MDERGFGRGGVYVAVNRALGAGRGSHRARLEELLETNSSALRKPLLPSASSESWAPTRKHPVFRTSMSAWITDTLSSKSRSLSPLDGVGECCFSLGASHRYSEHFPPARFPLLLPTKPTLTLANLLTNAAMGFVGNEWIRRRPQREAAAGNTEATCSAR